MRNQRRNHEACPAEALASEDKSMIEQIKKHWLIGVISVCAITAISTWKISDALFVQPRDFKIRELEQQLASKTSHSERPLLPASPTAPYSESLSVREGESVTSSDGGCNIKLQKIVGDHAQILITLEDLYPKHYEIVTGRNLW